jgi:hypothetical protein
MANNTATGKDSTPLHKQGNADMLKRLRHLEKENAELKALQQAICVSVEQHRAAATAHRVPCEQVSIVLGNKRCPNGPCPGIL